MNWKHIIDIKSLYVRLKDLTEDYQDDIIAEDKELKEAFDRLIAKLNSYPFMPREILKDIKDSYADEIGLDLRIFNSAWNNLIDYCKIEDIWVKNMF